MKFECRKTENCFVNSRTYEYALPVTGEALCARLPEDWTKRRNMKLRRPVFVADREGVNLKGALAQKTVKASFPEEGWKTEKAMFERWLEELDE